MLLLVVDYCQFLIAPPGREHLPFVVSFSSPFPPYEATAFLPGSIEFLPFSFFSFKVLTALGGRAKRSSNASVTFSQRKREKHQTTPIILGFAADCYCLWLFSTHRSPKFSPFLVDSFTKRTRSSLAARCSLFVDQNWNENRKERKETGNVRSIVLRSFRQIIFQEKKNRHTMFCSFSRLMPDLFSNHRASTIAGRTADVRTVAETRKGGISSDETVETSLVNIAHARVSSKKRDAETIDSLFALFSFFFLPLTLSFIFSFVAKEREGAKIGVWHRRTGHSQGIVSTLPVTSSLTSESPLLVAGRGPKRVDIPRGSR